MSKSETAVPTSEPQIDDRPLYEDCAFCILAIQEMSAEDKTKYPQPILPQATKRRCRRCAQPFCTTHVSPVSPIHCSECRPLVVHEEQFSRTDVHETYDEVEDKVTKTETKSSCTRITFEGLDGSFYADAIASKSIEELKGFVKAHQAIVRMMEDEILTKTIKKNTEMFHMAGAASAFVSSASGAANKTKTRSAKPKKEIDFNSLVTSIKNSLTPEQLQALKLALGGK